MLAPAWWASCSPSNIWAYSLLVQPSKSHLCSNLRVLALAGPRVGDRCPTLFAQVSEMTSLPLRGHPDQVGSHHRWPFYSSTLHLGQYFPVDVEPTMTGLWPKWWTRYHMWHATDSMWISVKWTVGALQPKLAKNEQSWFYWLVAIGKNKHCEDPWPPQKERLEKAHRIWVLLGNPGDVSRKLDFILGWKLLRWESFMIGCLTILSRRSEQCNKAKAIIVKPVTPITQDWGP